jgi:hypothetical protein
VPPPRTSFVILLGPSSLGGSQVRKKTWLLPGGSHEGYRVDDLSILRECDGLYRPQPFRQHDTNPPMSVRFDWLQVQNRVIGQSHAYSGDVRLYRPEERRAEVPDSYRICPKAILS